MKCQGGECILMGNQKYFKAKENQGKNKKKAKPKSKEAKRVFMYDSSDEKAVKSSSHPDDDLTHCILLTPLSFLYLDMNDMRKSDQCHPMQNIYSF